ncbi:MAG: MarR family transcriptional regulator [Pseudomonadota bacterium]
MDKPLIDAREIDGEAVRGSVRTWLRLLATTNLIERELAARLRARFNVSLARFDYMAQLDRAGGSGLTMGALGARLMVTGGNITGLTDRLQNEGLVRRMADSADRRVQRVALTPNGKRLFRHMATEHADWVRELFDGLNEDQRQSLSDLTGALRQSVMRRDDITLTYLPGDKQ